MKNPSPEKIEARRVIQQLGGVSAISTAYGVKTKTINSWAMNGLPAKWRVLFAALRPDIFRPQKVATLGRAERITQHE